MLIVMRTWDGYIRLALCEEIQTTKSRVYVKLVKGDDLALAGRGDEPTWYASPLDVLTFDGTEAMFDVMELAMKLHDQRIYTLRQEIANEREAFNQQMRELARGVNA